MPIHKSSGYFSICVVRNASRGSTSNAITTWNSGVLRWNSFATQWNTHFAHSHFYFISHHGRILHFALFISLTLLLLTEDRSQISSLVYAVLPGIMPGLLVIPHNEFVALCKHNGLATRAVITHANALNTTDVIKQCQNVRKYFMITHKYIWVFLSHPVTRKIPLPWANECILQFNWCIGVLCAEVCIS